MSQQSKRQSIGYIIKGSMKTSIPAKQLIDVAYAGLDIVPDSLEISNDDTLNYASKIAEKLEFSEEMAKDLRNKVYYAFDMLTEQEAGQYYNWFAEQYPMLNE